MGVHTNGCCCLLKVICSKILVSWNITVVLFSTKNCQYALLHVTLCLEEQSPCLLCTIPNLLSEVIWGLPSEEEYLPSDWYALTRSLHKLGHQVLLISVVPLWPKFIMLASLLARQVQPLARIVRSSVVLCLSPLTILYLNFALVHKQIQVLKDGRE